MRIGFRAICIGLLAITPAVAADPVFGRFVLDAAQSTGGERCAVTTLDDLGNGKFHLTAERIFGDGKREQADGIFAFDGADHPDGIGSLAFTRIDDHRYVVVSKGSLHATAMRTLSDDGTTMTETADGIDNDEPFHATRVWVRGPGGCEAPP